jgi:hypothetical protein
MTLMMAPMVTIVMAVVVPAIVRPDNDACRLGRHASGRNAADRDHRGDQ